VKGESGETNKVHLSTAEWESGTFSRAKNGIWGKNSTHGRDSIGSVPHTKYIEIHRVNRWATGARAYTCQDLRDFRDRDDVSPERLLTLRGGASAITSLSISVGLRRLVVPRRFLEGFDPAASLAEERLVRVDRFPAISSPSSSSSSVSSSGTTSAFALPLPLLLLAPVSATTVVLVEDADEEERARLELPPAAETAVDDPEENEGDLSRVRRTEEREGAGLACAFLPKASLLRPRDVPA
jgi:hypothetical protein